MTIAATTKRQIRVVVIVLLVEDWRPMGWLVFYWNATIIYPYTAREYEDADSSRNAVNLGKQLASKWGHLMRDIVPAHCVAC